jgi:hypothetical protein
MELYPPPDNGGYATPWLWVDGRSRGWEYQYWRGYVEQQMAVPSDVGITIDGTFDPVARTGLARAVCTNGSGQSVTAACQMVLTEDSVYYPGTNGDYWHNHLCRDYLPDEHGTEVVLAPGGCDTVVQSFALEDTWDAAMCNIVVYLQNMTLQPDSSMPVFQGAIARLSGFTAVEEPEPPHAPSLTVSVSPNPAGRSAQVRFTFDHTNTRPPDRFSVCVYSPDGRLIRVLSSSQSPLSTPRSLLWDRRNGRGRIVSRGVYHYRLLYGGAAFAGSVVLTD